MPPITDEELIARLCTEALAECERCQGREHGDCSDGCRWFFVLASPAELEPRKLARKGKYRGAYGHEVRAESSRTWRGPVAPHERWDKEEVA